MPVMKSCKGTSERRCGRPIPRGETRCARCAEEQRRLVGERLKRLPGRALYDRGHRPGARRSSAPAGGARPAALRRLTVLGSMCTIGFRWPSGRIFSRLPTT
jgi:hypothetical protein